MEGKPAYLYLEIKENEAEVQFFWEGRGDECYSDIAEVKKVDLACLYEYGKRRNCMLSIKIMFMCW